MTNPTPHGQVPQQPCPTCAALARTVMLDQVSFDRKPDCYGIRQITDDEGVEEWEDIRTSPDVAREEAYDMMATGRGEIYEVVPLWTTPQPSPTAKAAEGVPAGDERATFEANWRARNPHMPLNSRLRDDGRYGDHLIQKEWEAWQARAARASADSVQEDAARLDWLEQNLFHREISGMARVTRTSKWGSCSPSD